jgi:hypothetical protein
MSVTFELPGSGSVIFCYGSVRYWYIIVSEGYYEALCNHIFSLFGSPVDIIQLPVYEKLLWYHISNRLLTFAER